MGEGGRRETLHTQTHPPPSSPSLSLPSLSSSFPSASSMTSIWLDDVSCAMSSPTLLSCDHRPVGTHDCTHSDDVALYCGNAALPAGKASLPSTLTHFNPSASPPQ